MEKRVSEFGGRARGSAGLYVLTFVDRAFYPFSCFFRTAVSPRFHSSTCCAAGSASAAGSSLGWGRRRGRRAPGSLQGGPVRRGQRNKRRSPRI